MKFQMLFSTVSIWALVFCGVVSQVVTFEQKLNVVGGKKLSCWTPPPPPPSPFKLSTVQNYLQSSQWSHLQSAWPRCMSCQKKKDAKNFSPLVHLLKYCLNLWALNLAILPPLPVCRHFSHFKRERRKLCWSYFPTGPIIVTFSMIENRHHWCLWSDVALSNYMIKPILAMPGFWKRLTLQPLPYWELPLPKSTVPPGSGGIWHHRTKWYRTWSSLFNLFIFISFHKLVYFSTRIQSLVLNVWCIKK